MSVTFELPGSGTFELPKSIGPGQYIAKLVSLEDAGESKFLDQKTGKPKRQIAWWWELGVNQLDVDGRPDPSKVVPAATNSDGTPFLFRDQTTASFGRNPKTSESSGARARAEALLRRTFTDTEAREVAENTDQLLNKGAIISLYFVTASNEQQYLRVKNIEPYRKGAICQGYMADGDDADASSDELPY